MATGTGKTYTTFQIIWRLWKARAVKRVLFLVDRNILADQTLVNDFKPFGSVMAKVKNRRIDPSYEIHLAFYQASPGRIRRTRFSKRLRDFFDMIVIDECHRGSAAEDSAWREILEYFSGAIQLGMTATPKETKYVSNLTYFGDPVYTYSLKQGIADGFLAPYKVVRIDIDKDLLWLDPAPRHDRRPGPGHRKPNLQPAGYGPHPGAQQAHQAGCRAGHAVSERHRPLSPRPSSSAKTSTTPNACGPPWSTPPASWPWKTPNMSCASPATAMRARPSWITFIDPESRFPVIATTSELLTTGVDAKTCKLIVLDKTINSMTIFKQIIGRGTRIDEENNKWFFTIMDFKKATELFKDPDFDGEPVVIYEPGDDDDPVPPDPEAGDG
jgi:type I restriction enzyme R subunit